MRLLRAAIGTAATSAMIAVVLPMAPAAAAETDTLYVNHSVSCTDNGGGTAAHPYCTIGAAARAVLPGQTVQIDGGGTYAEQVAITRSGTPDKPITFTSAPPGSHYQSAEVSVPSGTAAAVTVTGAHDVVLRDLTVSSSGSFVTVTDSARVTLDHLDTSGPLSASSTPGIRLSGTTTDTVVSRNSFFRAGGLAVQIDAGVKNSVVTGNLITAAQAGGISATDAPGTVVTGNTVHNSCRFGINLTGAATTAQVWNNILTPAGPATACPTGSGWQGLTVSAESAPGVIADYNIVQAASGGGTAYHWSGADLADAAAFAKATGQGAHDSSADPHLDEIGRIISDTSAAVDSAAASAPGELDSDYDHSAAVDDPRQSNSAPDGGFRDRGARELRGFGLVNLFVDKTRGGYPLHVTATAGASQIMWNQQLSATVDFGDGTAPVTTSFSALIGSTKVDHVYAAAGVFQPTLTVTDAYGTRMSTTSFYRVTVGEPGPPKPVLTVSPSTASDARPLSFDFDGSASTTAWSITNWTVDFGDGTSETDCRQGRCTHAYAAPGHYPAVLTVTDSNGGTASLPQPVDVAYTPSHFHWAAGRILDTRMAWGAAGPIGPDSEITLSNVANTDHRTTAVVLNVTVVDPTAESFLTVYPSGRPRPITSNSNFVPGQTAAHLVTVPVGADGRVKIYNHVGTVNVVADLVGWYTTAGEDGYAPLQPSRVLDTRSGVGTSAAGQIQPGGSLCFKLPTDRGVPADVDAVALNLTATNPSAGGYLTATFDSNYRDVSSLNYSRGETVSNQVIVPMQGHQVCLNNGGGAIDAVADLVGYYSPGAQGLFTPVGPARLLDTRTGGTPIAGGDHRTVTVGGTAGIPGNAVGAVLNVTATEPDEPGHLIVYPTGTPVPGTSNVNFAAGQTVPNHVTAALGAGGATDVLNAHGHTHAIVDVFGYFTKP